jgi:tetratricopeptide (TPR) repeat protein/tRNA A-37 threonylcarbamoyl transferase component Bud32
MGVVYRARDAVLEREVALKLIRDEVAGDGEVRRRFLREARLAAAINHPGIATLYEAGETVPEGETGKRLYLASELVAGRSLEQVLRDGPLAVERALDLGAQLAEALAAAHELGIVHRDIKPSNLMIATGDRLKVLDFGIAKRVAWRGEGGEDAQTLTCSAHGAIVGTPAYMAPEQVAGGDADARTDVHGVGCVLYQMLTGEAPFGSGSPSEVMRRVIVTPPKPLQTLRPGLPRAVAEVVQKALAKEPGERYQSAAELAQALRDAAAATGLRRVLPQDAASWRRRFVSILALAAVIGAGLFAAHRLFGNAIRFEERDWLLVTDVINGASEDGLTLALKSALETDLRQSRHVNVFDQSQVRNTLRMMRREPSSPVDLETGIELCRFAGVRALLVPQIHAAGDVFILQASLVDPTNGRTVDGFRLTARGRDEVLLESIDALTRQVRRRLGESLRSISETDPPLAQYTTSSWEALRLHALGMQEWAASRMPEAARCFEMALERDPEFATARGSLGLVYIQFLDRPEEGRELLEQAMKDASEISRREFLHLRAVHRQFVERDLEGALADYGLVSSLYPDAITPFNNSGRIMQGLERYDEALEMYQRAREVDPRSPFPLYNIWTVLNLRLRRPIEAEPVARELVTLQPDSPWARHALGWTLVSLRRFDEGEEAMRAVLEVDPLNSFAMGNLAHLLMRRHAYHEASEVYRTLYHRSHASADIATDIHDVVCLALALRGAGRFDEAEEVLEAALVAHEGRIDAGAAWLRYPCLLAALGRRAEALSLARVAAHGGIGDTLEMVAAAETFSLLGETEEAVAALEAAVEAGYGDVYLLLIDPLLGGLTDHPALDRLAPVS